jgi:hypothetical protein
MAKNIDAIAKDLGLDPEDLTQADIAELEAMADSKSSTALAPSKALPAPVSVPARPTSGKPSQAKEAIAETLASTDATVARVLKRAQAEADRQSAETEDAIVKDLGTKMNAQRTEVLWGVHSFLSQTVLDGQWLLSEAKELILEGELVD